MSEIITIAVVLVAAYLVVKLIMTPMKWLMKLLLHAGCGFVSLFVLNILSGFTGLVFEINFITAAIAGILGLPGVALLAIVQLFF